jgi:FAD/FMN-containing dehydrogenase
MPAVRGTRMPEPATAQARALAAALGREIRGEVRFDRGSRALFATDGSNYRQVPIGVVFPRDADDVVATLAHCRQDGVPVLGRGAGTSLAGQCCNVAVVLDFSRPTCADSMPACCSTVTSRATVNALSPCSRRPKTPTITSACHGMRR